MDNILKTWNSHYIRKVRNSRSPSGRPSLLHKFPELNGTRDYLCEIDADDFETCMQDCVFRASVSCDGDIFEMCSIIMAENDLSFPEDPHNALQLYMTLRDEARAFLPR